MDKKKLLCYWAEDYSVVKIEVVIKMLFLPLTALSNYFFAILGKFVMIRKKEYHKWIAKATVKITSCILQHETGNEKILWLPIE